MTETTRAASANKPADHKPAADETVAFEFAGASFDIPVRAIGARLLRSLEKNRIAEAAERLIGEDGYDRLIEAIEAEHGWDDMEKVADFMNGALEAAGSKNS